MVAPYSVCRVVAIASEAVLVWALSLVSNLSTFMLFSLSMLSRVTTVIEFSKDFGFFKAIANPPFPNLFSGFFLASFNYLLNRLNSSSFWIVWAPSSATLFAAPGSSISKSISWVRSCFYYKTLRPSSLTSWACFSFSSFVLKLVSSAINSWTSFSCSLISFAYWASFSFFFASFYSEGDKVLVASPNFSDAKSYCAISAIAFDYSADCPPLSLLPIA